MKSTKRSKRDKVRGNPRKAARFAKLQDTNINLIASDLKRVRDQVPSRDIPYDEFKRSTRKPRRISPERMKSDAQIRKDFRSKTFIEPSYHYEYVDGRLLQYPLPTDDTPSEGLYQKRRNFQPFVREMMEAAIESDEDRFFQGRMNVVEQYIHTEKKKAKIDKLVERYNEAFDRITEMREREAIKQRDRLYKQFLLSPLHGVDRRRHLTQPTEAIEKAYDEFEEKMTKQFLKTVYKKEKNIHQLFQQSKHEFNDVLRGLSRKRDGLHPFNVTEYPGGVVSKPMNYFHDKALRTYSKTRMMKPVVLKRFFLSDLPQFTLKPRNVQVLRNWLLSNMKIPPPIPAVSTKAKLQRLELSTRVADSVQMGIESIAQALPTRIGQAIRQFNPSTLKPTIRQVMVGFHPSLQVDSIKHLAGNPVFRRTMVAFQQTQKKPSATISNDDGKSNSESTENTKEQSVGGGAAAVTGATDGKKKKFNMKELYQKYGKLVVAVYLGVYVATLAGIFATFLAIPGLDPHDMIEKVKSTGFLSGSKMEYLENFVATKPQLTTFFAAWCATKLTEPVRAMVTLFITKYIGDRREAAQKQAMKDDTSTSSSTQV